MATLLAQSSDPLSLVGKLGESFAFSGMFGCKTKEQGHVLALHCVMENVSPLTILQTYHFIDGKLSMRADAMLGRANAAGFKHKVLSRTADLATIYLADDDDDGKEFSLSWADCQKEPFVYGKDKVIKTNYATPRARTQMMWARVVSEAVRTMCPAVVCGAYTPEEISDFDDSPATEAIVVEATAVPATGEKKTRKKSDSPATTAAVETQSAETVSAESSASNVNATEPLTTATVDAVATTLVSAAASAAPATTAKQSSPKLPQVVIDIVGLRDYVGPRWPADSKQGSWDAVWGKVKTSLNIPAGESDEERFTRANESMQQKAVNWLNQQRVILDKLATSKDLSTWANQSPTTAATATAKA